MATVELEHLRTLESLDALYGALDGLGMTPGWISRDKPILSAEPDTAFLPMHWRWAESRALLDAAGRLIDTKLAERRNLVMRNPVPGNDIATLRTLVCAYQSILPGETARSHRHAPHALRVIIEADGAYSTVNGEKHPMNTGDIVLTPGWCWHGHGHDGQDQAYWWDGLDVPLTHLLEPMFFEEHPAGFEPVKRVTEESPYRFTWETTQRRLERAEPDPDGVRGRAIALEAPEMPTMGLSVQRLDGGTETRPCREAANSIYVVMQGHGVSTIGESTIAWQRGDTVSAPCWRRFSHRAESDAVLFRMSDEPLMRFARYYRAEMA